jgi:hypothetical protein
MGVQTAFGIRSHEKVDVLAVIFIGIEMDLAVIHLLQWKFHTITVCNNNSVFRSLATAPEKKQKKAQEDSAFCTRSQTHLFWCLRVVTPL